MGTSPTCAEDCEIETLLGNLQRFIRWVSSSKQKSFFSGRKGKQGRDTVVHATHFNDFEKIILYIS